MSTTDSPTITPSDETLIYRTRAGDQRAFAELWHRHYRSGARVARQFTSSIDADDLVSEAYTRIYQRLLAGGGPTGAFRPYLYTTIRNLASTWGAAERHVQVDDIAEFEDPSSSEDPASIALDKTLTARAFRSLPARWQAVLWYTEVEGMDPHEVAPLLGMSANSVAALSYRAREGLRKAWLQAHISEVSASGECQWTISKLGEHARHSLGTRDSERIAFHLATCAQCSIIGEEVDEVGSRLALVMLPILLGSVVGGTMLSSLGTASAASATAIPAVPALSGAGAVASGAGLLGTPSASVAFIGTLAMAVAIGGASVVAAPAITAPQSLQSQIATPQAATPSMANEQHPPGSSNDVLRTDDPAYVDPLGAGAAVGGAVGGVGQVVDEVVGAVVFPLVGSIAPDLVTTDITLSGHGAPGAVVTAQAAGVVYASTTIAADGTFSLVVIGLPQATSSLQLSQSLGGVLGALGLNIPLSLDSGAAGIAVDLLN